MKEAVRDAIGFAVLFGGTYCLSAYFEPPLWLGVLATAVFVSPMVLAALRFNRDAAKERPGAEKAKGQP